MLALLRCHSDALRRHRHVLRCSLERDASLRPGEQLAGWVSFVSSARTVALSVQQQLAGATNNIHTRLLCPVLPISGHSCHRQRLETKCSRNRSRSINGQRRRNKTGRARSGSGCSAPKPEPRRQLPSEPLEPPNQVFLTRQHRSVVAHTPPAVLQARSRRCPHQTRLGTQWRSMRQRAVPRPPVDDE